MSARRIEIEQVEDLRDLDDDHGGGGKAPAQWFVRFLALAFAALAVVAIVGSRDDIVRYARIKQM